MWEESTARTLSPACFRASRFAIVLIVLSSLPQTVAQASGRGVSDEMWSEAWRQTWVAMSAGGARRARTGRSR